MLNLSVQARSDKVDIFGIIIPEEAAPTLRARPVTFEIGKRTTDPEFALLTLTSKQARDLARKLLRATTEEDE